MGKGRGRVLLFDLSFGACLAIGGFELEFEIEFELPFARQPVRGEGDGEGEG
jgi:hypothetical protein